MAEDSKNLTIIWSITGTLAMIAGGIFYYEFKNKYKANNPKSPQSHNHYSAATTHMALPIAAPLGAPTRSTLNTTGLHYPFIIGLSNKTYDGYRKVTCDDWNQNIFKSEFINHYKKNEGIQNVIEQTIRVPNLLIFDGSYPRVDRCHIELDDIKKLQCKLQYYTESGRKNLYTLKEITPDLLRMSFCIKKKNQDVYHSCTPTSYFSSLFASNEVLPCLFVREGSITGSSRRSSRRSQKKRTRKH